MTHKWYILQYHDFINLLIFTHFEYYKWKQIVDVPSKVQFKVLHLTRYTYIKTLS